ncbi:MULTISPECIES: STAS/SEC14 domain-containing protein [Roseobacteraceae]|uniref:SpoIIAA-like protein n=1 Tax=Pseudosulfitobacter pseudonitzschiae TaxID=1402135 RepID=A0A221JXR5_9RHOB|nr:MULTISPECIES: STAS/SEC14 domain-containing protein [Roseobacteraceae]ASM71516.1 SpoIIAA-like protein [Pseudosulfitobacter pseudonitzschiae]
MMTVSKPSANRVDIVLSGPLDAEMMGGALDRMIAASEGVSHGQMCFLVEDFEMPTVGAMMAELVRMPRMMAAIMRFDRCAVLSDVAWLRTTAEIEGRVIPSIEIKSFALAQGDDAEAWLAGEDDGTDEDENFPV